jgi:serine/threonine protein kinase
VHGHCAVLVAHRNIVSYLGFSFSANQSGSQSSTKGLSFVQEYAAHGDLRDLVLKQMLSSKPLYSYSDALRWSIGIARGLRYLHSAQPLVHFPHCHACRITEMRILFLAVK